MRWFLLVMVGCGVEAPDQPIIRVAPDEYSLRADHVAQARDLPDASPDLCVLAAALPPDDICSLVCDPDALRQALIDTGRTPGVCYEISCALDDTTQVSVGVCLVSDP
ncbi:MAG: hypothetical protein QM831_38715 [Kofleriaceae bacterium]